jgi:hypothetical protein
MIRPRYSVSIDGTVYIAHVTYGLIFRKTERVGMGLELSTVVRACLIHHKLHHPNKNFYSELNV